jgi:hypothetical protein
MRCPALSLDNQRNATCKPQLRQGCMWRVISPAFLETVSYSAYMGRHSPATSDLDPGYYLAFSLLPAAAGELLHPQSYCQMQIFKYHYSPISQRIVIDLHLCFHSPHWSPQCRSGSPLCPNRRDFGISYGRQWHAN